MNPASAHDCWQNWLAACVQNPTTPLHKSSKGRVVDARAAMHVVTPWFFNTFETSSVQESEHGGDDGGNGSAAGGGEASSVAKDRGSGAAKSIGNHCSATTLQLTSPSSFASASASLSAW